MNTERFYGQPNIELPDYVRLAMDRVFDAGEEIYLVGGSLRDILLGNVPSDYDMTTSATPERVAEIFADLRVIPTGLAHGTQTVLIDSHPIEITTFRVDGNYLDSRRPESVSFTRSLKEDLARRDFTVNAIAYSPQTGVVDIFDGCEDLIAKIIRAVGEPQKRFEEDALRILRAFRFSAQLGFSIEEKTLSAAVECRGGLEKISKERIGAEMVRPVSAKDPEMPLLQMKRAGILSFALGGFEPDDADIASLASLKSLDVLRLGALLFSADDGQIANALAALKCSNKQKTGVRAVIRGARQKISNEKEAALLRADVGAYASLAAALSVKRKISCADALRLVEKSQAPTSLSELDVNGSDLSKIGFVGKEIGNTLEFLFGAVINDPTLNQKEKLLSLAIKKRKQEEERE